MKKILFILFIFSLTISPAFAQDIVLIAGYSGNASNTYTDEANSLSLKGSGPMQGIFAQWLNPESFNTNLFVYQAQKVNASDIRGVHFILDGYSNHLSCGKTIVGIDIESINIDMTNDDVPGLSSFGMDNNVLLYMLRAGQYWNLVKKQNQEITLLSYLGYTNQKAFGTVTIDPPGPAIIKTAIKENDYYLAAGFNLSAKFFHFVDAKLKYLTSLHEDVALKSFTLEANIYLSRNIGISYKRNVLDMESTEDAYNLLGLVYCF